MLDSFISYLDTEMGDDVVIFLHGNPTSAYLWRNVMLEVKGVARCIAPDLIGHGYSGKEPNNKYRLEDHYRYFCAWMEALNLPKKVTLVSHDWGNGLAWHWANMNRDRVKSLVYMEAAMAVAGSWEKMSRIQQQFYKVMRSPQAEDFINSPENFVLDSLFANSIQRKLEPEEEAMWRAPMQEPGECRRPIVTWCREVPIKNDGPDDVIEIFKSFRRWLSESKDIPKLYIDIEPGMLAPSNRLVTSKWPNQKMAKAKGLHFCQEDDPVTIGRAIAKFLQEDVLV